MAADRGGGCPARRIVGVARSRERDRPVRVMRVGAESVVTRDRFLGLEVVVKERRPKGYRHPGLESRIRRERMVQEARTIPLARRAGVRVPAVVLIDLERARLVMEHVAGPTIKEAVERRGGTRETRAACVEFGRMVGRLHKEGIVHGDLTTSNVVVSPRGPTLLDFGLSSRSTDVEAQGADLILLEHAFRGLHPGRPELLAAVIRGYRSAFDGADHVIARARVIEGRRRYA